MHSVFLICPHMTIYPLKSGMKPALVFHQPPGTVSCSLDSMSMSSSWPCKAGLLRLICT